MHILILFFLPIPQVKEQDVQRVQPDHMGLTTMGSFNCLVQTTQVQLTLFSCPATTLLDLPTWSGYSKGSADAMPSIIDIASKAWIANNIVSHQVSKRNRLSELWPPFKDCFQNSTFYDSTRTSNIAAGCIRGSSIKNVHAGGEGEEAI